MPSKGSKKPTLRSIGRERNRLPEETLGYLQELNGQSDRSCAILASLYIEHALTDLIKSALIQLDEKQEQRLFFDRDATIGTFARKTDIAHALGLITDEHRNELNIIRSIRNTFAHTIKTIRFSDELLRKEIIKLTLDHVKVDNPSDEFFKSSYIVCCHRLSVVFSGLMLKQSHAKTEITIKP